ncbi:MAG: hypothetical protein FDZ69_08800 [Deltaproteobacteria bacterium]|nr:MAG: hypothetical protein FDZ69_08800 [Deltaproteobacteria bacterium]
MLRTLSALAVTLLLAGCGEERGSGLSGQLLFQDRPLAQAQVEVYLKADKDRSVQPFAVGNTDAAGNYRVELPPGRYFVIGKQRGEGPDGRPRMLMADAPGNPYAVERDTTVVPAFNLREMGREGGLSTAADSGVSGKLTAAGRPLDRAFVYVYTETATGLMGPSYGEAVQADGDGAFRIDLPAGRYHLVARRRADGSRSGELAPGDLNGAYPGNPVTVRRGEHLQLGPFPLTVIDAAVHARRQAKGTFAVTGTMLTGQVLDPQGEPVRGVHVFAYLDSRMVGKPVHISAPTGTDGKFQLHLGEGGTYFVGARSNYGGPLEPGEWVGTFDGRPDHAVTVAKGSSQSLGTLTVREVW